MRLNNKNVLVIGTGIECDHVERLARDFNHVWYYTTWQKRNPKFIDYIHGQGLADNIEKVLKPFKYVNHADLICFLDTGWGDQAQFLREHGHRVFGAGNAEDFEAERFKFRKLQGAMGLPTQETVLIKGVKNLRGYLKKHRDVYVKLDVFRGDFESFHAPDLASVEMKIIDIEQALGPFKDTFEFVVEESIEGIESGVDAFFSGEWCWPMVVGYELDGSYIGKTMNESQLPAMLAKSVAKLQPVLKAAGLRGARSLGILISPARPPVSAHP